MKKYGWISLMLCVLLLLGGCAKEQEAAVQPPEFPLDEQTVYSAFEDAGFSVILSEEDTKLYNRLGIHVSCEPKYEIKKLYHK